MAEDIKYKIYKMSQPGTFADPKDSQVFSILPGYNTPHGFTETTLEDYEANASARNRTEQEKQYKMLLSGTSDYAKDPVTGNLITKSSLQQQQQEQADLAAGKIKNIGTASAPLYVPVGSPGDLLSTNPDAYYQKYPDQKPVNYDNIKHAQEQLKNAENSLANDQQLVDWKAQLSRLQAAKAAGQSVPGIPVDKQIAALQKNIADKENRMKTEVSVWQDKIKQLNQTAFANSPEAEALLKSDPQAYLEKYGTGNEAQSYANEKSGQPAAAAVSPQASLQMALQQVYATRPDLQAVYNPDGSAKNPNDPRVAGIPTLTDWARKFGVNESPLIKQAMETPAASSGTPTGSVAGAATGTQANDAAATGGGVAGSTGNPVTEFEDIYNEAYKDLGLNTIKEEYNNYNKEILKVKDELADKVAAVNDNPWISETQRSREITKLNEKYSSKLENLAAFLTLTNNLYQQGVEQARFLTTGTYEQNETQRLEAKAKVEEQIAAAKTIVDSYNVKTPYFNKGGTFFVSSDGKGFAKPEEFFAHAGVSSFQEAYDKGLITDIDQNALIDKAQVMDIAAKYPDAGIRATDSLDQAMAKLGTSRIYREQTRPPSTGGGGNGFGIDSFSDLLAYYSLQDKMAGTEGERAAAGYADRLVNSNGVINNLQNIIAGYNPAGFNLQLSDRVPNNLKSANVQQQLQAERDFVNAILRRESGAAISESEFANATKQYFPRPGDKSETLKQKALNRQTQINNLIRSAGRAYQNNNTNTQKGSFSTQGADGKIYFFQTAEARDQFILDDIRR